MCAAIAQGRDLLLRGDERVKRKQEEFFQRHDLSEFESLMRAFDKAESLNFDPQACAPWGIHARAAHEALRSAEQLLRLARRGEGKMGRRGDTEMGRRKDIFHC